METRSNAQGIRAAMSPTFGWKEIAALAFYGTKTELEEYLKKSCFSMADKVLLAIDTQMLSNKTLVGANYTAYGFVDSRNSSITGLLSNAFVGEKNTVTKDEYMQLLTQYVGLFAIREYIRKKIRLLEFNHAECQMRINIFSRMLTALNNNSCNEIIKIAKQTPSGIINSSEFYDLVTSFAKLTDEQMMNHFTEYKKYIVSFDDKSMIDLDKTCIQHMVYNKGKYLLLGHKDQSSLFFQLPIELKGLIYANLYSLERPEVCTKNPDEIDCGIKITNTGGR